MEINFLWVWPEPSAEMVGLQEARGSVQVGKLPGSLRNLAGRDGITGMHGTGESKFRSSYVEITKPDPCLRNRRSRNSNTLYFISSKSTCSRGPWFSLFGEYNFSLYIVQAALELIILVWC